LLAAGEADVQKSGADDFEQALESSRRLLASLPGGDSEGATEGHGEAADGLIRAVASGGRIDRVELSPRVMRMDSQTLAEEITRAVNAALAELRTSTAQARGVDLAALQQQLRQAQDEGVRRMALFTSAIQDAVARINRDRPTRDAS
jgi:DNA-binding protein YbaB